MKNRKYSVDLSHGSMTKQSFKDECDINKIMEKFQKTGVLNHYASHAPTYGDASPVEYLDALLVISTANEMFADLPASVRKRFNNNPEEFLEFAQDPKNVKQMRELGLASPLSETSSDYTPPKPASADTAPTEPSNPKDV